MLFEFQATIDGSYITRFDDPLAPSGSTLFGWFTYDPAYPPQSGPSHIFAPGTAELVVYTHTGFALPLENRVTNVAPTQDRDYFTVQSFVSESPNDWHIVLDLEATGWLDGASTLPAAFPEAIDYGFMTVYFTDEFEWIRSIEATVQAVGPDLGLPQVIGETGSYALNHRSTTVTLDHAYDNPVVIAHVSTKNGPDPVAVRIEEIQGDQLTFRLQEPDYLDGWHRVETVNFLVVEAGAWRLPGGALIEAGTRDTDTLASRGFSDVTYDAPFADRPLSFSQVQTENGSDFVVTRQRNGDSDGIEIAMQEQEARQPFHVTETLGWVAYEGPNGWSDGTHFQGSAAVNAVNSYGRSFEFDAPARDDAMVIAGLSTFNGADTAWLRGTGASETGVDLVIEEETSRDAETFHVRETVDVFAFTDAGTLMGHDLDLIA